MPSSPIAPENTTPAGAAVARTVRSVSSAAQTEFVAELVGFGTVKLKLPLSSTVTLRLMNADPEFGSKARKMPVLSSRT